jgi:hypothetical protein
VPEIFRNLLTTGDQPILWHSQHMCADGPHINIPGKFSSTLEMKILLVDDIVVTMCGLQAAAACMLKDSFPVQSNVTTEFQATSRKDRDHMDIKKLCSSQDPVKRNSRCALFQIINCCNYTHYTYYVFTSR